MKTAFALAALLALAAAPVAAGQAVVKGDWIALGDVAPVTGDAAKVLIAPAPPPGQTLAIDPAFVTQVAKKSGIVLVMPLDQPIMVSRAGAVAPEAPVAKVAKAAPSAPKAPVAPSITSATAAAANMVLVLVRDVPRGARLTQADLDWVKPQPGVVVRGAPDTLEGMVGQEARRLLKAGSPLLASDVKAPAVIHKGDPVKLYYAAEGLRLTVDGQAQNDAAAGDSVRVLNRYSKRSIDAVATADGEARVSR